jgi:hypothetical protein
MARTTPPGGLNEAALETIDNHWAVRVIDSEDRAVAVRHAISVLNRIAAGDATRVDTLPPLLVPLASAYALAGRELLDFEGAGAPSVTLSERQNAVRRVHLEAAASQAFLLMAAQPIDTSPDEHPAMLYRTLMMTALARVGERSKEFEQWLLLFGRVIFPSLRPDDRWDLVMLRRVVELWTHILRGNGPSGLRNAMEIIASIREERPDREAQLLAEVPQDEQPRLKLHLFSLFHLAEAATDLLLFRMHGEPESVTHQLYGRFLLAREGAAGDPRLDATCDWLFEASRLVVEARSSQLELMSEGTSA